MIDDYIFKVEGRVRVGLSWICSVTLVIMFV